MTIIAAEAKVVRWVFESFLAGMTPWAITEDLNKRGVVTAQGKKWTIRQVLRLLDSHHVAGLLVFRGVEIGPGTWPAIIDVAMFREVQERRAYRSVVNKQKHARARFYLLHGLVWCTKCGRRMPGKTNACQSTYTCSSPRSTQGAVKCYRTVAAPALESFVADAAISLLERLDVSGQHAAAILSDDDHAAISADRAEIAELKDMWDNQELKTSEYRQMRKTVEDRIRRIQAKTIIRPAAEVLEGMTGPDARAVWDAHMKAGNYERLNAVLRFLFAAVRIGESRGPTGQFDYARIDIEQNEI